MEGGSFADCLMVATVAAICSYIPIGNIASRVGRKKTILAGIALMSLCYFAAVFVGAYHPLVNIAFAAIGVGCGHQCKLLPDDRGNEQGVRYREVYGNLLHFFHGGADIYSSAVRLSSGERFIQDVVPVCVPLFDAGLCDNDSGASRGLAAGKKEGHAGKF